MWLIMGHKIVYADYIPQSDRYKTVFHWGEEDMEQPVTFGAISMHSEDVNNFGDWWMWGFELFVYSVYDWQSSTTQKSWDMQLRVYERSNSCRRDNGQYSVSRTRISQGIN